MHSTRLHRPVSGPRGRFRAGFRYAVTPQGRRPGGVRISQFAEANSTYKKCSQHIRLATTSVRRRMASVVPSVKSGSSDVRSYAITGAAPAADTTGASSGRGVRRRGCVWRMPVRARLPNTRGASRPARRAGARAATGGLAANRLENIADFGSGPPDLSEFRSTLGMGRPCFSAVSPVAITMG